MADNLGTSVDVASTGDETYYLPGHPRYDAVKFEVDASNTTVTDADIEVRTYDKNDVREAKDNGDYSSMDSVYSVTGEDVSSGGSYGTTSLARTIAVNINAVIDGASDGISGTLYLHESSDPAQNGHAFVDR